MTNAEIQARWAEIINIIGDELTTNKVSTLCSTVDVSEDNAMQVDIDRTSMIEYTHIDQCAHDTADYWNSFAAQTVRQYVKRKQQLRHRQRCDGFCFEWWICWGAQHEYYCYLPRP
jgi:hypothetical protein